MTLMTEDEKRWLDRIATLNEEVVRLRQHYAVALVVATVEMVIIIVLIMALSRVYK